MKKCFKCGEEKPYVDFYKHPRMSDGYLGKCKECTKKDSHKRFVEKLDDPIWANKERKRQREKEEKRRVEGKVEKSTAKRKIKVKPSNRIFDYAVQTGKIQRLPCEVCGKENAQGHHEDYSEGQELNVQWLCTRHHADRHIHLRDSKCLSLPAIEIKKWIKIMINNNKTTKQQYERRSV